MASGHYWCGLYDPRWSCLIPLGLCLGSPICAIGLYFGVGCNVTDRI
jgi:hypothetical protein